MKYTDELKAFTEESLPTLDSVVLGALEFLGNADIPRLNVSAHTRPFVVGSVGGLNTAKILFEHTDAVIADEGSYRTARERIRAIDAVYIVSASGNKHAVHIAEDMKQSTVPVYLVTSTHDSPASKFIPDERVFVFPHIREPYTYNTSTYLGMLFGGAPESPHEILSFIETEVAKFIPVTLANYASFVLTVPPQFGLHRAMFVTKFDELFAPLVTGRAFTSEEIKHAKIVVPSPTQCFLNFDVPATPYAPISQQFQIPLPPNCSAAAMLAIGYYVIGRIQAAHPPYFKEHIRSYTERAQEVFGQSVPVIVE
jgi:hypothetical protein